MKERPILFRPEMVRAILHGRKTQTRRVIKTLPSDVVACQLTEDYLLYVEHLAGGTNIWPVTCPYGDPGDRLWVKEAWAVSKEYDKLPGSEIPKKGQFQISYFPNEIKPESAGRNRSSRFMPRWASRIMLKIVNMRVERVQEITSHDAMAEGWPRDIELFPTMNADSKAITWFHYLWDSINGIHGYGWCGDPWVWVIEFKKLDVMQ
jgi:hypothetical protein